MNDEFKTDAFVKKAKKCIYSDIGRNVVLNAVWDFLLCKAEWKPEKRRIGKKQIIVERGQVLTSITEIANHFSLDRGKIRRALHYFIDSHRISSKSEQKFFVITICNYNKYQGETNRRRTGDEQEMNRRRTGDEQDVDLIANDNEGLRPSKKRRREEDKEVKKEDKIECESPKTFTPYSAPFLINLWNAESLDTLPKINLNTIKAGSKRCRQANLRFKEHPDEGYWGLVMARVNESSFCTGKNDRVWLANIDWFLRPDTHIRLMEGQFDDKKKLRDKARGDSLDAMLEATRLRIITTGRA